MLSVVIATLDSERPLVATLAALVPGAMDGLVSEVLIADGGSRDGTAEVADAAGCEFRVFDGPLGRRLKMAAAATRAPWLLFLQPDVILDAPWNAEARGFLERKEATQRAAVFRRGVREQSALREALWLAGTALGASPRPAQGLLLPKSYYEALGGHRDGAADPETDLIRRIGRRRIVTLSSRAYAARP